MSRYGNVGFSGPKGPRQNRDLVKVAKHLLAKAEQGWLMVTEDITSAYDLTAAQVQRVKQHAKRIAAEHRLLWSYDPDALGPGNGRFRYAPANAPEIAERMFEYAVRAQIDSGRSLTWLIDGLLGMGYISREQRDDAQVQASISLDETRDIFTAAGYEWREDLVKV